MYSESSPIATALRHVKMFIPRQVYEVTFIDQEKRKSFDAVMIERVIEAKVRPAINSVLGRMVTIPFARMIPEQSIPHPSAAVGSMLYSQIFRVPPDARDYAEINGIIRVAPILTHYGISNAFPPYNASRGNTVMSLSTLAVAVTTQQDAQTGPIAEILDSSIDMIRVTPPIMATSSYDLECTLAFNHDFMDLPKNLWESFADVVLIAVKSHVYHEQFIDIDAAKLSGGQALGAYKEVVDRYLDEGSPEKFREAINNMAGAMSLAQNNVERLFYYML